MAGISSDAMLAVIGLLTTGAASAIFRKIVYQMSAPGWHGHIHTFEKPWFTTFLSTTTCSTCLLFLRLGWGASFGKSVEVPQQQEAPSGPSPSIVRRTASAVSTSRQRARRSSFGVEDYPDLQRPLLNDAAAISNYDYDEGSICDMRSGQGAAAASVAGSLQKSPKVPYHDTMHPLFWERGAYGHVNLTKVVKLIAPAVAGHLALILQGIGLQFTSASVNQMVSGSCIIFTAMLSVAILKRRLTKLHVIGVALSMVGVAVVSLSSVLPTDEPPIGKPQPMWLTVFGIVVTLISQIVQAVQLVLEELMLRDLHLHPFQVLGYEGIIGIVWMVLLAGPLLLIIPGMDVGSQENTVDTMLMLWNSPGLTVGTIIYWFTVLGTNMCGVLVSATIGSIFRSVLLTTRTVLVWVVDLLLFYTGLGGGVVGESWERWSWIEAVGFVFLLAGTIIYAAGSQNAEEAVEKAVLTAVEAQLGGTAGCTPQGSSPRQTSTTTSPSITEAQQQMQTSAPGLIPGQSRRVLVRKVSGLNALLESDERVHIFYSGDTPLGVSPDMEPGTAFAAFSGTSPAADGSLTRTVVLEGLDANQYTGSSSYVNPFIPRLPPSITGQAVEDILGTDVDGLDDNPVSYLQSPVIASPRSATHQGSLSPLLAGMSPPSLSAGPGGPNRTTRLLNNVRSYLETGGTERPPATVLLLPGASNGQPQQQQQP